MIFFSKKELRQFTSWGQMMVGVVLKGVIAGVTLFILMITVILVDHFLLGRVLTEFAREVGE